jgi:hypothetical protein
MAYELSFSSRQWWAAVAATAAILLLTFAAGFVGGALWERSQGLPTPAAPTASGS